MGWTKSLSARWWMVVILVSVRMVSRAAQRAIYLDEDQTISLRARIYSQAAIRLNDSQADNAPRSPSAASSSRTATSSTRSWRPS